MEIFKQGSGVQKKVTSEYFLGTVFQDPIIVAPKPSRISAIKVSFEPKARTVLHAHPLGQTLFVFLELVL